MAVQYTDQEWTRQVQYTDQILVIPADVCEILDRSNLLESGCDDFG